MSTVTAMMRTTNRSAARVDGIRWLNHRPNLSIKPQMRSCCDCCSCSIRDGVGDAEASGDYAADDFLCCHGRDDAHLLRFG